MPFNPQSNYVHLGLDGSARELPGGSAFWELPEEQMSLLGNGWLLSEYEFTADWATWEKHPNGDEFIYLLTGSLDLLLEYPRGVQAISLRGSGALLIPQGVWHTAKVHKPSRMLHVTRGESTETRPV
jgi:hypothetical protein